MIVVTSKHRDFMRDLLRALDIPAGQQVRRVVIDVQVNAKVVVYVQKYLDTGPALLEVLKGKPADTQVLPVDDVKIDEMTGEVQPFYGLGEGGVIILITVFARAGVVRRLFIGGLRFDFFFRRGLK